MGAANLHRIQSLFSSIHTAQTACSCFWPMDGNGKNLIPHLISFSFKATPSLLQSADTWAEQVPFNCFSCLLQSWPTQTGIKHFSLRARQSASASVSWQPNTGIHCKFTIVQTQEKKEPHILDAIRTVEQPRGLHVPALPKQNFSGFF